MKLKKAVIVILLVSINFIYAQTFFSPGIGVQGEPVTFVMNYIDSDIEVSFSLYNSNGKRVLYIQGFNYYFYEEKMQLTLGLGAIPVNMPAGDYTLKAEAVGFIDSYYFEEPFRVVGEDFKEMTLKANSKMDNLVNGTKEPEREAQSKRLWEAISSFSPHILYEKDKLSQPVDGKHTSPFGFTRYTIYPSGKNYSSYHKGEDLAASVGTPVLSDGAGRVILVENRIVTGNTVVVEHLPGVKTLYYHMDSVNVNRGDVVEKGTKIGEVGSTGYSTGPHLHWEVRFGTVPVDPKYFLSNPLIDKTLILNMINGTNLKRGG